MLQMSYSQELHGPLICIFNDTRHTLKCSPVRYYSSAEYTPIAFESTAMVEIFLRVQILTHPKNAASLLKHTQATSLLQIV